MGENDRTRLDSEDQALGTACLPLSILLLFEASRGELLGLSGGELEELEVQPIVEWCASSVKVFWSHRSCRNVKPTMKWTQALLEQRII
jgi:hypothetical protein